MLTKSLVEINTVVNNSTCRIMHDIQREADISGMETLSIVGRRHVYTDVPCVKFGNALSFWIHVIWTTLTDRHGLEPVLSVIYTRKMVRRIREANPDIIHLHNIHGYYLHYPTLMKYLAYEYKGKIIWTFHDLWPITGHCAYYSAVNCDKWMKGCNHCPNKKRYPVSLGLDGSRKNYETKKELFTLLSNLTITVPSEWMASQVRQSFMGKYPVEVIHNGIDTAVFDHNRLIADLDIESNKCADETAWSDKKILLSVASIWDERKGLKDLVALSDKLSDDYVMVIVGLSKHQINRLPKGVIGITRTENIDELVSLYSRANIFINPSLEEAVSPVTVEALSCGCPCSVLDTSAVAELVNDDNGVVLHSHKPEDYLDAIKSIENRRYNRESVRATALKYDNKYMLEGYMRLYGEVLRDES